MSAEATAPAMPWRRIRPWAFFFLVLGTTAVGTALMLGIVRSGGIHAVEMAIVALFVPTFGWICVAFWTGMAGFVLRILRRDPLTLERRGSTDRPDSADLRDARRPAGRTAVVMPVFNEEAERVVRGLEAVAGSVAGTGNGGRFDFFLLSDTNEPSVARDEAEAFRRLARRRAGTCTPVPGDAGEEATTLEIPPPEGREEPAVGRFVYRRRPVNTGRKAGNIAEFCRRWGEAYEFMVVLDADSLMSGRTLASLVRLMEQDPELGLVQTVPLPARQETLFGRLVQFGAALQAPLLAAGQSFWQGETANYWGHNAVVRTSAFMEHCELPVLPGAPPLGGEILSHDFVEAALLRRAGWKVQLHPGLDGSFEEVPGDIPSYATRDRRWAQGSLQHLKLLGAPGLHPMSRAHFLFGAMGYVSSLLWLLMLLASTAYVLLPGSVLRESGRISGDLPGWAGGELPGSAGMLLDAVPMISLLAVTAAILFAPRLLAVVVAWLRRAPEFGGRTRLLVGSALETLFTVVVAPVLMMFHARFVVGILGGRSVRWEARGRESGPVSWRACWRSTGWITGAGVLWAGLTLYHSGLFFLWLSPIFVGLIAAVPLARWTSHPEAGRRARTRGLFLVPTETSPHNVIRAADGRWPTQPSPDVAMEHAERALFELRRGRPLLVAPADEPGGQAGGHGLPPGSALLAAVESLRSETLERLSSLARGPLDLVMTNHRARAIDLPGRDGRSAGNGHPPEGWAVRPGRNGDAPPTPERILHLSSAATPSLPTANDPRPATAAEVAGLALVRADRMLPAVVSAPVGSGRNALLAAALEAQRILRVSPRQIRALTRATPAEVRAVSDAPVPLEAVEAARFVVFQEVHGLRRHLAVLVGDEKAWPAPLPVRVHSACLTGDLFGSLRCDCGEQLRESLRFFAETGGGILLYLEQEGRGIGLGNKLRAYSLQQEGLDTVDANCTLGFEADPRRYEAAVAMLGRFGIERIQLLTNNPHKVRALEAGGIHVVERRSLHGTLNRHNLPYVSAKADRAGHWLQEMLSSSLPDETPPET